MGVIIWRRSIEKRQLELIQLVYPVFLQIIKNTYTVLPMFKYYSLGALHISTHLNL